MNQFSSFQNINAATTAPREAVKDNEWQTGEIKWFDEFGRRIGFIIPDHGDSDIFFSWQVLRAHGIRESRVKEGVRVEFVAIPPEREGRRPRAVQIRLV